VLARGMDVQSCIALRACENSEHKRGFKGSEHLWRVARVFGQESASSGSPAAKTRKRKGRPKKAGSTRATAAETGTDRTTQGKMEKQVAYAERFPFLKRPGWGREKTLKAGKLMESFS
jgi:hypothetical protein